MGTKLVFVDQALCFFGLKCWPSWFFLARLYVSRIQNVGWVGFCLPGRMFFWFKMLTNLIFVSQAVCFCDPKCWPSWLLFARRYVSLIQNVDQVGLCWPGCMFLWSKMLAKLAFACQVVRFFDLKCWPSLILLARLYASLIQHAEQVGFCWPGCMFLWFRMLTKLAFVGQAMCFSDKKMSTKLVFC